MPKPFDPYWIHQKDGRQLCDRCKRLEDIGHWLCYTEPSTYTKVICDECAEEMLA